jgi:hypothetical protein
MLDEYGEWNENSDEAFGESPPKGHWNSLLPTIVAGPGCGPPVGVLLVVVLLVVLLVVILVVVLCVLEVKSV